MTSETNREYMTTREVLQALGVSRNTLKKMIASEKFPEPTPSKSFEGRLQNVFDKRKVLDFVDGFQSKKEGDIE